MAAGRQAAAVGALQLPGCYRPAQGGQCTACGGIVGTTLRLWHEVTSRASEAAGTRGARGGPAGQEPGAHGVLVVLLLLDQEE